MAGASSLIDNTTRLDPAPDPETGNSSKAPSRVSSTLDLENEPTPYNSCLCSRDPSTLAIDIEKGGPGHYKGRNKSLDIDEKESTRGSCEDESPEENREPAAVEPEVEDNPPPDGGMTAWLQVFGGHVVMSVTWGYINSYGVFQSYYLTSLPSSTPSAISWVGSVQIFLIFLIGTFTGRGLDAGYYRHLHTAGSLLLGLGVFMNSLSTKYWQLFLTHGIIVGLANGMLFCPTVALVSTYFRRKRALAVGLVAAGTATGGIAFPFMVTNLLPILGFANTMRSVAGLMLALLLLSSLILKPRLKPRKTGGIIDRDSLRDLPYLLFTTGMWFVFLGLYFPFYYLPTYSALILPPPSGVTSPTSPTTPTFLILMNGIGFFGRLIPNYLSDVLTGPYNLLIPFCLLTSLFQFIWISISTVPGLYAFSCLYGLSAAGVQSLFPAALAAFSNKDPSKTGVRMGMVFSAVAFACLVGTPVGGALLERMGGVGEGRRGFVGAQVFGGLSVFVGMGFLVAGRWASTGGKWRVKI